MQKRIMQIIIGSIVFNAVFTGIWMVMMPISIKTGLKDSVPFLVIVSLWANFASHMAGAIAGLMAWWEYKEKRRTKCI
jgi:hypothetical protein